MKTNDLNLKVILKLSGEALSDSNSHLIFSKEKMSDIVGLIKKLISLNIKVGIVCGAGNIFRGRIAEENGIPYEDGDYMGMVGTVINLKAISSMLDVANIKNKLYSALAVEDVAPKYEKEKARKELEEGYVILFAGGVGKVRHTTDTCAALRAIEMDAKIILAGKNGVDGVYSADPKKDPTAVKYDTLTYMDVIQQGLMVMDTTATSMCMDNDIDLVVFNMNAQGNILKAVMGEQIGTIVKKEK